MNIPRFITKLFSAFIPGYRRQISKDDFPFTPQRIPAECGPACLKMITDFYGWNYPLDTLNNKTRMDPVLGTNLLSLKEAATEIGLNSLGIKTSLDRLLREVPLPAIAFWNGRQFIVVYHTGKNKVYVADPAIGKLEYSYKAFAEGWLLEEKHGKRVGILLVLERR